MSKGSIDSKYIIQLLVKDITYGLSEQELHELNEWINASSQNKELYLKLYSEEYRKKRINMQNHFNSEKAWLSVLDEIKPKKLRFFNPLIWQKVAVAASILLIATLTFFLSNRNNNHSSSLLALEEVKPGSSRAVLTLADGSKVELENLDTTILISGADINIKNSKIYYQSQNESTNNVIAYNSLETPKGGEYNLTLSDGTKVWLNTASKIRYPQSFEKDKRSVYIEGEVYFEVAKNTQKPFFVHLDDNTVRVIGTSFNIRDYPENANATVTLCEGSIELTSTGSKNILSPNQQAIINNSKKSTTIISTNAQLFTAWKDGKFLFKDSSLKRIMNDLSRWYNVNLFYTNEDIKELKFSLYLDRQDKIEKILEMIEATEKVKFSMKEGNLIISPM